MSDTTRPTGQLLVLSGPSGVGKTTVCDRLHERGELTRIITCTTRLPREGEVAGQHYHFLNTEEFQRKLAEDGFLEHALVHGNYYGTPSDAVQQALATGKTVLLAIDVQGAEQLRKQFVDDGPDSPLLTVFLLPPDEETLESRLRDRSTEAQEQLALRLEAARHEMAEQSKYDLVVVNDNLETAVTEILNYEANPGSRDGCNFPENERNSTT